jgi:hypothetical protein
MNFMHNLNLFNNKMVNSCIKLLLILLTAIYFLSESHATDKNINDYQTGLVYLDSQAWSQLNEASNFNIGLWPIPGTQLIGSLTPNSIAMYRGDSGQLISSNSNFNRKINHYNAFPLAIRSDGYQVAYYDSTKNRIAIEDIRKDTVTAYTTPLTWKPFNISSIKEDYSRQLKAVFSKQHVGSFATQNKGSDGSLIAAVENKINVYDYENDAFNLYQSKFEILTLSITERNEILAVTKSTIIYCKELFYCKETAIEFSNEKLSCDYLVPFNFNDEAVAILACDQEVLLVNANGKIHDSIAKNISRAQIKSLSNDSKDITLISRFGEKTLNGWVVEHYSLTLDGKLKLKTFKNIQHRSEISLPSKNNQDYKNSNTISKISTPLKPPPVVLDNGLLLRPPSVFSSVRKVDIQKYNSSYANQMPIVLVEGSDVLVMNSKTVSIFNLETGELEPTRYTKVKAFDSASRINNEDMARVSTYAILDGVEKSIILEVQGYESKSYSCSYRFKSDLWHDEGAPNWDLKGVVAINSAGDFVIPLINSLYVGGCTRPSEIKKIKAGTQKFTYSDDANYTIAPSVAITERDNTGAFKVYSFSEDQREFQIFQFNRNNHGELVQTEVFHEELPSSKMNKNVNSMRTVKGVPENTIAVKNENIAVIASKDSVYGARSIWFKNNEKDKFSYFILNKKMGDSIALVSPSALAWTHDDKLIIGTSTGYISIWTPGNENVISIAKVAGRINKIIPFANGVVVQSGFVTSVFVTNGINLKHSVDLFVDPDNEDSEVVAITKEGFFSGGHKYLDRLLINYKQNEVISVAPFYDAFHRPDIVRAKLRGEDIRPLIGDLTIEKALQNPPPKVSIAQTPAETSSKRLKIPYTITPDNGGIAEVRIFHNGKLISSDGTYKDAPGKAYAPVGSNSADAAKYADTQRKGRQANVMEIEPANSAAANRAGSLRNQLIVRGAPEKTCNPCKGEIDVDVIPGEENTISIVAFNRDNTIQSVPASVSFKSTLPKEEPHLWILSVGINQFKSNNNLNFSALKNANKDAYDFACTYAGKDAAANTPSKSSIPGLNCTETGKAQSLFKPQNIHLVDTLLDSKATKANIQAALDNIAKQAKPGDTFVWFVASHGMMDANSLFGIIAHDTTCTQTDAKGSCTDLSGQITSNDILEASKKIKAMKQLMVLDTCQSGGLDSKMSGLYDARMSLLAKNMGLHMYASAQATELAQDGIPGTNGAFTAQLLAGIKGAAPKNSEGQISIMTLGQYAKQKTIEATQKSNTKDAKDSPAAQTPVIQHFGLDAGLVGVGMR